MSKKTKAKTRGNLLKLLFFTITLAVLLLVVKQVQTYRSGAAYIGRDYHIQNFNVTPKDIVGGNRNYDVVATVLPKNLSVAYVEFYYKTGVPAADKTWVLLGRDKTATSGGRYSVTGSVPYTSTAGHWTFTANVRYNDNSWCTGNPAYTGKYKICTGNTYKIMVGPTPN